jgi:hypothetical protein
MVELYRVFSPSSPPGTYSTNFFSRELALLTFDIAYCGTIENALVTNNT